MTQGDSVVLDFAEHLVGYVTLSFETEGSHPDAPVWLDLRFAEREQELNERASAQGIYLYCEAAAKKIASVVGDYEAEQALAADYEAKKSAAKALLYDGERGVFVSGEERQVSIASQVWMILGGVSDDGEILDRAAKTPGAIGMVTPYLYHHYVQALIDVGRKAQALDVLRAYWGGMAKEGGSCTTPRTPTDRRILR